MDAVADDPTLGQGDSSTSNSSHDPLPEQIASLFTLSKLKATTSADEYICELVADTLQDFTIHTGVASAAEAGRDALQHSALPTQSFEDNAFGKSEALLKRVERAKAHLRKLEVEANKKVDELEEDLVCQDIDYQTRKSELEDSQEELVESFEELDGEVSILSNIAARIGERLETAEAQRKRAEDTVELILYIQEFAAKPGDLSSLSDIFTNDARFAEAAPLARRLLTLVEGMAGSMGTTTTAHGAETIMTAMQNLQEYCNSLENRLLARFDKAEQKKNTKGMMTYAEALVNFNGGASVIQRWVASRPMFMNAAYLMGGGQGLMDMGEADFDEDPEKAGEIEELAQMECANSIFKLRNLYKDILTELRPEVTTLVEVFPSGSSVMALLVRRVMEQRVQMALEELLPPLASEPTVVSTLRYLRVLGGAYEATMDLARSLQDLGRGCSSLECEAVADILFSQHRDDTIPYQLAVERALFEFRLAECPALEAARLSPDRRMVRPPSLPSHGSELRTFGTAGTIRGAFQASRSMQ